MSLCNNLVKYEVGRNLETDVLLIFRCLGDLDVSYDCHVGALIFFNILKRFGYKVEVVRGYYSSPYLHKGKRVQHSWAENIINISGLSEIIETTPDQMFPELDPEERVKSIIVPPDDKKWIRYNPVSEHLMREIFQASGVRIDKKRIQHLSHLVGLCIDKTIKKMLIRKNNQV